MRRNDPEERDVDALVELLDSLAASGSQHIHIDVGEQTQVRTINSTECPQGPCMIPNFDSEAPEEEDDL